MHARPEGGTDSHLSHPETFQCHVMLSCYVFSWICKSDWQSKCEGASYGRNMVEENHVFKTWLPVWIYFALSFGHHQAWLLDFLSPRDCHCTLMIGRKLLSDGQRGKWEDCHTATSKTITNLQKYVSEMDDCINKLVPGLLSLHFDQFWWRPIKKPKKIWILLGCQFVCFELEKEKSLPPPKKDQVSFPLFGFWHKTCKCGTEKISCSKEESLGKSAVYKKKGFLEKKKPPTQTPCFTTKWKVRCREGSSHKPVSFMFSAHLIPYNFWSATSMPSRLISKT